jgi:hypothetical protein
MKTGTHLNLLPSFGLLICLAAGCTGVGADASSSQDGSATEPEAVGEQSSALGPAPVQGPTGQYTGCTSVYECTASSGYPELIITCPQTVTFEGPGTGSQTGTTFEVIATNITPTYPVYAEIASSESHANCGMTFVCTDTFPTYQSWATSTYCGSPGGGGSKCKAPLHDCGDGTCVRFCT